MVRTRIESVKLDLQRPQKKECNNKGDRYNGRGLETYRPRTNVNVKVEFTEQRVPQSELVVCIPTVGDPKIDGINRYTVNDNEGGRFI